MILDRWRKGTPEEFWAEFSVEGQKMPMTMIVKHLRAIRVEEDKVLADQARREYGASFDEHFFCRKGSIRVPLSNSTAIAKRYRELKSMD